MAGPWAVSVIGGILMTAAALTFAATGLWLDAGLSAVGAFAFGLAGRQTLMVITLAGALTRRGKEDNDERRYLP